MRVHVEHWQGGMRRLRRRRWTPGRVIAAAILGIIALSLVLAVVVLAVATAALAAAGYIGFRLLRRLSAGTDRRARQLAPQPAARAVRPSKETRGLLEMARTPDPLDRYLIAVREFDRLSGATLAVDPAELGRKRAGRRADELADQAYNLHDAIAEIERELRADGRADRALAGVWELSVAASELWIYCRDLNNVRGTPSLQQVRYFVSRRTALLNRRDALVVRLQDTTLRELPAT